MEFATIRMKYSELCMNSCSDVNHPRNWGRAAPAWFSGAALQPAPAALQQRNAVERRGGATHVLQAGGDEAEDDGHEELDGHIVEDAPVGTAQARERAACLQGGRGSLGERETHTQRVRGGGAGRASAQGEAGTR